MINKISREFLNGFDSIEQSYIITTKIKDITFKVLIKQEYTNQNNYINFEFIESCLNDLVDLKVSFKVGINTKEIIYNIPLTIKQICKLFNEDINNISIEKYIIDKLDQDLIFNYVFGLSLRKKVNGFNYWCIINNNLAFKGYLFNFILGIEILGSDVFNEFNKNVNQQEHNFYISKSKQGKEVNFKVSIKQIYNIFNNNEVDLTNKKYKLTNLSNNKNDYTNNLFGFYESHYKEFRFKQEINNLVYRFKFNKDDGNIINNCFYFNSCLNDFENKKMDDLTNEKIFILREIHKRKDKRSFKVSFNDLIKIFELKDYSHIETLEINKDMELIKW